MTTEIHSLETEVKRKSLPIFTDVSFDRSTAELRAAGVKAKPRQFHRFDTAADRRGRIAAAFQERDPPRCWAAEAPSVGVIPTYTLAALPFQVLGR